MSVLPKIIQYAIASTLQELNPKCDITEKQLNLVRDVFTRNVTLKVLLHREVKDEMDNWGWLGLRKTDFDILTDNLVDAVYDISGEIPCIEEQPEVDRDRLTPGEILKLSKQKEEQQKLMAKERLNFTKRARIKIYDRLYEVPRLKKYFEEVDAYPEEYRPYLEERGDYNENLDLPYTSRFNVSDRGTSPSRGKITNYRDLFDEKYQDDEYLKKLGVKSDLGGIYNKLRTYGKDNKYIDKDYDKYGISLTRAALEFNDWGKEES